MLIKILALAALAPLMLIAACGGDDDSATNTPKPGGTTAAAGASSAPKDLTITAADFSLSPNTISGAAGQEFNLTFKNNGSAEHSFTIGDTDVTEAEGGDTKTATFTLKAGDTEFHCKYHPTTMKGTITISGSSSENIGGDSSATVSAAPAGLSGGFGY